MFQYTHKFLKSSAGFAYILGVILIVTSLVMSTGIVPASAAEPQAGIGDCTNYDVKPPGSGTKVSYSAPEGQIIRKVTIKAGSQNQEDACYGFAYPPAKQNDGCYEVSGLGSGSITAKKIGDGPDCKDISHIEIDLDDAPTPTSTPVTPTPTDTPEEPTPTNTPEEPTPTNTPVPPTPTNTPEEPTETSTPGPSPTPTNTPEEPTPTNTPIPPTETPVPSVEPSETAVPTETPLPTNTPTITATLGTPVETQDPVEVNPEPTKEPKEKNTATPVPTVPAPNTETETGSDVLIPVTGVDFSFQESQKVKFISNLGYIFFGLGIVLHGVSLKTGKDDDEM